MNNLKSARVWAHAVVSAAIGGGSSAVLDAFSTPASVRFDHDSLKHMALIAGGGAVLAVLGVMKKSPLEPTD